MDEWRQILEEVLHGVDGQLNCYLPVSQCVDQLHTRTYSQHNL